MTSIEGNPYFLSFITFAGYFLSGFYSPIITVFQFLHSKKCAILIRQ